MRSGAILSQAFQARIRASSLLLAAPAQGAQSTAFRSAADEFDAVSAMIDFSAAASTYAAMADVLRIAAQLVEWRDGVLDAVQEVDRFLRAAKERSKLWLEEYRTSKVPPALGDVIARIDSISEASEIEGICCAIAAIPLPVPFFAAEVRPSLTSENAEAEKAAPDELTVAFLRFAIDGAPATETHFLRPREAHDLEIEVRVSRWPEGADVLQLSPISIESPDTYDFPRFRFAKPLGDPPFILNDRGRAILKAAQGLHARPFEFKYRAEFSPRTSEQPVAVVGQRTLRVEGIDIEASPITGYFAMDRKLLDVRDRLRSQRFAHDADLKACLTVLAPLCSLACRAIQDGLYRGVLTEAQFQRDVRAELRRWPSIGGQLDEHAHAAGGITDLSFRGIPIELKVESNKRLTLTDCECFVEQTSSYVVAKGKRLGVLCVLDCSEKKAGPNPADEGLGILLRRTNEDVVCVVTVIIQGNFPPPSHYSR